MRDSINLEFRKLKEDAANFSFKKAADTESYIQENCQGNALDYFIIADDGLTRSQAWKTKLTTLQPGYRSDALVVFPEVGKYCVIDTFAPGSASVSREKEKARLLAVVDVQEGKDVNQGGIEQYVTEKLVLAADNSGFDESVKTKVKEDLNDGLKLSLFNPHPDITQAEVADTKGQELAFFINILIPPVVKFEVSNAIGSSFDPKPYDPNRIDRKLKLGDAEEWTLESYFVSHPFHIHVNPFQIVKVLNPEGKDVSCTKDKNRDMNEDGEECFYDTKDPQYTGLKGVWKDTLWVKGPGTGTTYPQGVYTIVVRTRYQRYIGEFVLHCHILDHEDQGMMQNVSIVLPSELSK